ncbi:hypothetical protein [Peribacillus acanthi]|uniref:hypothetical protein n=1 Tax=Peribacillus acanthi TaxID=2171554 RepID=UPI000D3E6661|nr:hypothetical protein [Peribacillus acanthi]
MESFPNELDFISLFCTEPTKLDQESPFFYTESTFIFENHTEFFTVKVSPSYNEFALEVKSKMNGELIAYNSYKTVGKIEILNDKKDSAKVLLILDYDRDRYITTVEITFQPKFSFIIKEQYAE